MIGFIFRKVDREFLLVQTHFLRVHRIADQHRQLAIGIRADEYIDQRLNIRQLLFQVLRHTTQDSHDQRTLPLEVLELGQVFIDLIVGILANRAGVHQNYICALSLIRKHKSILFQKRANEFGIVLIHLTTKGFKMHVWRCGIWLS